jgi:hypothetical protein
VQFSPEVEFIGERIFKDKTNSMSKTADEHYNTMLSLGAGTSMSSRKENSEPKRLRPPSRYMCSPYEMNKRGTVQPNIMKLYNAITTLCDIDVVRE